MNVIDVFKAAYISEMLRKHRAQAEKKNTVRRLGCDKATNTPMCKLKARRRRRNEIAKISRRKNR